MALWVCTGCTTAYAVGVPRCPHCGCTDYVEQGAEMPKITVHGGPSNAAVDLPGGGEEPSPGSSSETSSEKQQTSDEQSESSRQKRARTTASPSSKGRGGSSTAASTGGSGMDEGSRS